MAKQATFGQMVKNRLELGNLTQTWLAEETGMPKSYISRVLNGKQKPSANLVQKCVDALRLADPFEFWAPSGLLHLDWQKVPEDLRYPAFQLWLAGALKHG